MLIERQALFESYLSSGVNLFLGAGFSILAQDQDGRNLPTGKVLRDELAAQLPGHSLESLPLPQLFDVLRKRDPERTEAFLTRRFTTKTFSDTYKALDRISIQSIITTNID